MFENRILIGQAITNNSFTNIDDIEPWKWSRANRDMILIRYARNKSSIEKVEREKLKCSRFLCWLFREDAFKITKPSGKFSIATFE